jgi:hypothetical protein
MSTALCAAPAEQAAAVFLNDLSLLEPRLVRDDHTHLCTVWESILNHLGEPERLRVLFRSLLHGYRQRGASPGQQMLISALVLRVIRAALSHPASYAEETLWVSLCQEAVRPGGPAVDLSRRVSMQADGTVRNLY